MPPVHGNNFGIKMSGAFSWGNLGVTVVWDPVCIWQLCIRMRSPALAETKFRSCWVPLWKVILSQIFTGFCYVWSMSRMSWFLLLWDWRFVNWSLFFLEGHCCLCCLVPLLPFRLPSLALCPRFFFCWLKLAQPSLHPFQLLLNAVYLSAVK